MKRYWWLIPATVVGYEVVRSSVQKFGPRFLRWYWRLEARKGWNTQ